MAYVLIALAILALIGAAALWRLDARTRHPAAPQPVEPAPEAAETPVEEPEADPAEEEPVYAEVVEEPELPAEPEVQEAPAESPETPVIPEPVAPRPEPRPEPVRPATAHRSSGLQLPGSTRRERKAWAEERGFEFIRSDDYLVDEWARGAAAGGAAAKDIVSGWAYRHEMLLMDLGGTNVMAMRTGAASDVVADFRRGVVSDSGAAEPTDLVEVERVGSFTAFGTDAGAVQRLIDIRVHTALDLMPSPVTAVWMESDWVLAQTARGSTAEDWEGMLAPLALLADAARVLPPRSRSGLSLRVEDFVPSRRMPAAPTRELVPPVPEEHEAREAVDIPPVLRPEEPLELPTRHAARGRGVVEPRSIGGDEIDPIADGAPIAHDDSTRVLRTTEARPTIFDDGEAADER